MLVHKPVFAKSVSYVYLAISELTAVYRQRKNRKKKTPNNQTKNMYLVHTCDYKGSTGVAQIGEREHVRRNRTEAESLVPLVVNSSSETGWTGSCLHACSPCAHSLTLTAVTRGEVDLQFVAVGSESKANMSEDGQYYGKHGNCDLFYLNVLYVRLFGSVKNSFWNLRRCVICFG